MSSEEVAGYEVVISALKQQGVSYIFGIVGIPIMEVALAAQQNGIKFIGMRNEQAACYAAQAMGYLTGCPSVCLVVSGPGVLHTLGGLANAKENCWPVILLGGASDSYQESCGAFQECDQIEACRPYCKYAARPSYVELIPYHIQQAFKKSVYGRPGAAYIDLPADILNKTIESKDVPTFSRIPDPPQSLACPDRVKDALLLLRNAKSPLVIVGKGAAFARAEDSIRTFLHRTGLPFLPTPMGKGVVPDSDPHCVSAARSLALKEADVILLLGARLNWMLHFGKPPRFSSIVKIIQVDILPEEFHTSVNTTIALFGDLNSVCQQLLKGVSTSFISSNSPWMKKLSQKIQENVVISQDLASDVSVPLNYYAVYNNLQKLLPKNCFFISEGANTMDIGRAYLLNERPRFRLDAGTFGTMGVGSGYAIAAALWTKDHSPGSRVVCVQGDSAFGFGAMEIETIYRYDLPIIFIIFNNNGIYGGLDDNTFESLQKSGTPSLQIPPSTLSAGIRYENLMTLFNKRGYYCETLPQLQEAINTAFSTSEPTIINIAINPFAGRKAQDHDWLTRSKL